MIYDSKEKSFTIEITGNYALEGGVIVIKVIDNQNNIEDIKFLKVTGSTL